MLSFKTAINYLRHPSSNSLTEQMFYYLTNLIFNSNSIHLAFAAVALRILYYLLNNKRLPPGPIGFPYIGYWPFFSHHNCHREMHKLAQKYGDIFSFMGMGRMYIHLGSYKAAKEAHVTKADCFSERMTGFTLLYSFLKDGMVFADREGWKTMRKFFFQQFRERGMTVIREAECGAIYQTIKETVEELKQQKGELVDLYGITLKQCNKIIQLTLLGQDGMTEQELQEFNSYYTYSLTSMTGKNLLFIGEIARFIFPFCLYFNEGMENHLRLRGMVYKMINKRKATYNENIIRDVVDAYFKERNDRKLRHDSTYQLFTDRCLMISLIQMIGDGCIFMGMFVSEFIKALLDHPEEQEKIYQELLQVCGMNRDPEISDKNRLMYTNAFISEVIRTTEVFTVFPSSECKKETTVCGYWIPKGAITVYNFYSAHMNINDYEKPEKFNPSRFLTKEGERPNLLPLFGIGKRACMGEAFAMNQVFLFLTILLKNFRLSKPPDAEDTSSFLTANKINTIIELRNHK